MKRNRPTAPRATKKLGLPVSVALHIVVISAMMISLPHKLDLTQQDLPIVPVELVTVADKTNIKSMSPKADKSPAPSPEPQPDQQDQKAEPQPEPQPQPKTEPAPKEKPTPAPEPKPEPAPKAKPQPQKPEPEKKAPEAKQQPPQKTEAKKKESFDINNIMALLDKHKGKSGPSHAVTKGNQTVKGFGAQDAMTADLRTMLQSQVYKCWNPPVGAPHADQLIVQFRLHLNKDGSIARTPELVNTGRPASDPYMRAAIEAARRAIYVCAPYKLPLNRYDLWRDVLFNFDPRDMIGQ